MQEHRSGVSTELSCCSLTNRGDGGGFGAGDVSLEA